MPTKCTLCKQKELSHERIVAEYCEESRADHKGLMYEACYNKLTEDDKKQWLVLRIYDGN